MGQIERDQLLFWCQKVVLDPAMLAEDPRGNKVGTKEHRLDVGEHLKTFCNIGVQRICRGMDYDKLDGMMANEIHDYLTKNWIVPSGDLDVKMLAAHTAAMVGDLAILSWSHVPHGHVAVVAPVKPTLFSGKWKAYCPQVANVGPENAIEGANYAFGQIPEVFILGRTIE